MFHNILCLIALALCPLSQPQHDGPSVSHIESGAAAVVFADTYTLEGSPDITLELGGHFTDLTRSLKIKNDGEVLEEGTLTFAIPFMFATVGESTAWMVPTDTGFIQFNLTGPKAGTRLKWIRDE